MLKHLYNFVKQFYAFVLIFAFENVRNTIMALFDRIKFLANKQGKSVNDVESELGYSKNTLYRLKKTNPSAKSLKKLQITLTSPLITCSAVSQKLPPGQLRTIKSTLMSGSNQMYQWVSKAWIWTTKQKLRYVPSWKVCSGKINESIGMTIIKSRCY